MISHRQFKRDVTNADGLAAEMAVFANSEGGTIFIGVADNGLMLGLDRSDVGRLNQLIGNAASQHVRSPLTVRTENVAVGKGRVVIVSLCCMSRRAWTSDIPAMRFM